MPTIAVIAPGAMGSPTGKRLADNGGRVLTFTEGRSEQSVARAKAAGMIPANLAEIAESDLIVSIVPPAEAVALAEMLAPALRAGRAKPAFADMNAINPETMKKVAKALEGTECEAIDGTIIGFPRSFSGKGPMFYVSGDAKRRTDLLAKHGLQLRRIGGQFGSSKALKMAYGGVNKGMTALHTAMLLAADRNGCAESLIEELAESAPQVLARMKFAIPDMYPKAYRWIAEMEEIAEFLGDDDPAAKIFEANAKIFSAIAEDQNGEKKLSKILSDILEDRKVAKAS